MAQADRDAVNTPDVIGRWNCTCTDSLCELTTGTRTVVGETPIDASPRIFRATHDRPLRGSSRSFEEIPHGRSLSTSSDPGAIIRRWRSRNEGHGTG